MFACLFWEGKTCHVRRTLACKLGMNKHYDDTLSIIYVAGCCFPSIVISRLFWAPVYPPPLSVVASASQQGSHTEGFLVFLGGGGRKDINYFLLPPLIIPIGSTTDGDLSSFFVEQTLKFSSYLEEPAVGFQ